MVFDGATMPVDESFSMRAAPDGPWTETDEGWLVDGTRVESGSDVGMLLYHKRLSADWIDASGERQSGTAHVNDAIVECAVRFERGKGTLRLRLVEAADTFEVMLVPEGHDRARALLTRRTVLRPGGDNEQGGAVLESLAESSIELAPDAWHRLRFSNVDNHLAFELDEQIVLRHDYTVNEPYPGPSPPGVPRQSLPPGWSPGPRVALGGDGLRAVFRDVRVLRDVYYTPEGRFGVTEPVRLGLDEVFLLGDNSDQSHDGRHWGPVSVRDVVGRPSWIVWPPSRTGRLEPRVSD